DLGRVLDRHRGLAAATTGRPGGRAGGGRGPGPGRSRGRGARTAGLVEHVLDPVAQRAVRWLRRSRRRRAGGLIGSEASAASAAFGELVEVAADVWHGAQTTPAQLTPCQPTSVASRSA